MSAQPSPSTVGTSEKTSGDKTPEEDVIKVKTLISSTSGDLHRASFIVTAVQRAMSKFGVTCRSVFQGEWVQKKIGGDFSHKLRCVWIDPTDNTFHWSKVGDRTVSHKRLRLNGRVTKVSKDKNFFTQTNEFSITVQFYNGEKLSMKWEPRIDDESAGAPSPIRSNHSPSNILPDAVAGDGVAAKRTGSGSSLSAMLDSSTYKPASKTASPALSGDGFSSSAAASSSTYVLDVPSLDVREVEARMSDWVKVFQAIIDADAVQSKAATALGSMP